MSKIWKIVFLSFFLFSVYHLIRDIATNLGIHNPIVDFVHRDHLWCGSVCQYITIPPEIFNIFSSIIILRRNRIGFLGLLALFSIPLWIIASLVP